MQSNQTFLDRTVLITGGTSGMGLETARLVLAAGGRAVITGRSEAKLEAAVADLGSVGTPDSLLALRSDASSIDDIARTADQVRQRFGTIEGLFANAGIGIFKPIEELTESDCDQLVGINFKGLFFTVQRLLPLMTSSGDDPADRSILLNASWTAHRGLLGAHLYSATKAAVQSLARTMSHELAERRVRVNSISPGYIRTPIVEAIGMTQEQVDARSPEVPAGRWGTPQEVASVATFLLSEAASYVNGQDILIDGGLVGAHRTPAGEVV